MIAIKKLKVQKMLEFFKTWNFQKSQELIFNSEAELFECISFFFLYICWFIYLLNVMKVELACTGTLSKRLRYTMTIVMKIQSCGT